MTTPLRPGPRRCGWSSVASIAAPSRVVFLPQFCVKTGETYEGLDYYRHLLSGVDVAAFDYAKAETWDFSQDLKDAKEQYYQVTLNPEALEPVNLVEQDISVYESDAAQRHGWSRTLAWTGISAKRLRRVVEGCV